MGKIQHIPPEIFRLIFQNIVTDRKEDFRSIFRSTNVFPSRRESKIAPFCLVCKLWLPFALEMLYQHLEFYSLAQCQSLFQTLEANPELRGLVSRVDLLEMDDEDLMDFYATIVKILNLLPSLRSVRFHQPSDDVVFIHPDLEETIWAALRRGGQISKIAYLSYPYLFEDEFQISHSWLWTADKVINYILTNMSSSVTVLHIEELRATAGPLPPSTVKLNLTSLSLMMSVQDHDEELLRSLTAQSPHLSSLELYLSCTEPIIHALAGFLPLSLQNLSLELLLPYSRSVPPESSHKLCGDAISSAISKLCRLRSFTLQTPMPWHFQILSHLPPTLEALRIYSVRWEYKKSLFEVLERATIPLLKKLELGTKEAVLLFGVTDDDERDVLELQRRILEKFEREGVDVKLASPKYTGY
ncbi:hypothetical protein BT69DRAFT_1282185 [Atractiella rhizophila]|nr:hypothetical protein BT69DRAFT_1282185 [Atractiella rhizophila]